MIKLIKEAARSWARDHLFTWNTLRYRVEFPRILEAFNLIGPQELVFDGGAGGGQMIRKVYKNGFLKSGIAFEFDPELVKILESNLGGLSNFETRQGSLLEIPYPDEHVDCAMTTQVLEHIEDHQTATQELARIVKKGGHLIVSVPHPPEPFHTPGHLREGYTEEDLIALFPADSFELLYTGYSMTRPCIDRGISATKLPLSGMFLPLKFIDCETNLTNDQRKQQLPYGITCLFKKL